MLGNCCFRNVIIPQDKLTNHIKAGQGTEYTQQSHSY